MKANIEVDINSEDINWALKEVVEENYAAPIRDIVKDEAKNLVQKKVPEILDPIIHDFFTNGELDFIQGYNNHRVSKSVEDGLKRVVTDYFNESVFSYSAEAKELKERWHKSSDKYGKTRIDAYLGSLVSHHLNTTIMSRLEKRVDEKLNKLLSNPEFMDSLVGDKVTKIKRALAG